MLVFEFFQQGHLLKYLPLFFLLLMSCTTSAKNSNERTIYKNEEFGIVGKNAGLPDDIRKIYISYFTDFISNDQVITEFDKKLRFYIEQNNKEVVKKIKFSQAVILGSIDSFKISPGGKITNIDSLYYLLILHYSVLNNERKYYQKDRMIREEILVMDTNKYLYRDALSALVDNAAKHTAEAVLFGWQLEYSRTEKTIYTLGENQYETNNSTNRSR